MNEQIKLHQDRGDGNSDFAKDLLKQKIGSSLRKIYDDVVNEPVPDDFLALLSQAESNTKSK